MKYKTAFRLAIKAIGVYFIVEGIPQVVQGLFYFVGGLMETGGVAGNWTWSLAIPVYGIVELLLGLYLFFGGEWVVNRAIPSNRPYCYECGYELTGLTGDRCPECGTAFLPTASPAEAHGDREE